MTAVDAVVLVLRAVPARHNNNKHRCSIHEENNSVDLAQQHSMDSPCTSPCINNFLCGGACRLEVISAPYDDVLKEILYPVPEKISGSSNNG